MSGSGPSPPSLVFIPQLEGSAIEFFSAGKLFYGALLNQKITISREEQNPSLLPYNSLN